MKNTIADIEYPKVLSDLIYRVGRLLIKKGFPKEEAEADAKGIAEGVAKDWGGQIIYFPKAAKFNMARRDAEIRKKWNGQNSLELCREYSLTRARLYQILKLPRTKRADS